MMYSNLGFEILLFEIKYIIFIFVIIFKRNFIYFYSDEMKFKMFKNVKKFCFDCLFLDF